MANDPLVSAFATGTDVLGITSIVAVGKKYVIFKIAGHKYWSSVMEPSAYAPVQYILIEKNTWMFRGNRIREWEGRTSKKELLEALEQAEKVGAKT